MAAGWPTTSQERKARLLPDEGHLSLAVGAYGAVLDDLLAAGD